MRDVLLEMPDEDPFRNDQFEREVIATNFMKIFDKDQSGIVLSIDSDWGTGKTTFIKMWEKLICNDDRYKDNYETIYFNAWDNDYMEDPLLSLFTEIQLKQNSEDGLSEILKEVLSPMLIGAKRIVDIGLKLKSSGAIGIDDFNFKIDDKSDDVLKEITSMGDEVLNRSIHARKLRDNFKEKIKNFQNYNDNTQKPKKKIIFFIDELDRCRPKFAIELLETIKHLFSVPGVIFVISLDKKQLSYSVATVYGQNMDTVGYLRRFFDLEYRIPKPNKDKYLDTKNYSCFEGYINTKYLKLFLKSFMIDFDFSLRDIDKAYFYIDKLLPLIKEYSEEYDKNGNLIQYKESFLITISYLYAYMICMKIKYEDLYKKIIDVNYRNDDKLIEDEFMIKRLRNINFYDYNRDINAYSNEITDNILFYYLKLNYLADTSSGLKSVSDDDYVIGSRLGLDSGYNMLNLFDINNKNKISDNLDFVNKFE